jgi:hypothetical protein
MVREVGLEPTQDFSRQDLNLVRLPISPLTPIFQLYILLAGSLRYRMRYAFCPVSCMLTIASKTRTQKPKREILTD